MLIVAVFVSELCGRWVKCMCEVCMGVCEVCMGVCEVCMGMCRV